MTYQTLVDSKGTYSAELQLTATLLIECNNFNRATIYYYLHINRFSFNILLEIFLLKVFSGRLRLSLTSNMIFQRLPHYDTYLPRYTIDPTSNYRSGN